MERFYLVWSDEEPLHPKDIYKESWNTGITWYGQINPQDKSLNEWKNEQVEMYDFLLTEYQTNGRIRKLKNIYNPTPDNIETIEKDVNFIEWCGTQESEPIIDKSNSISNEIDALLEAEFRLGYNDDKSKAYFKDYDNYDLFVIKHIDNTLEVGITQGDMMEINLGEYSLSELITLMKGLK